MAYIFLFGFSIIGAFLPVSLLSLVRIYILSIVLDEIRIFDVSISNILLLIVVLKYLLNYANPIFGKINRFVILLAFFSTITILSFLTTFNSEAIKSLISINFLVFNSIVLSLLMRKTQFRHAVFQALFWVSLITSFSVIIETLAFYILGIQFRNSHFDLINISSSFYFSSGFFSSNGLAAFHIIPGIVFLLFTRKESLSIKIWQHIIIWTGLLLTMTRGGIVVGGLVVFIYYLYVLHKSNKIKRTIGYFSLSILAICFANLIIFVSYFNISSVAARIYIINGAISSILQNPVFGLGISSRVEGSQVDIDFIDIGDIKDNVLSDTSLRETHNTLLQIGLETGLTGLFLIMIIFFSLLLKHKKMYEISIDTNLREYHLISFVLLLVLIVSINMNSYLYLKEFWILLSFVSFVSTSKKCC